MSDAYARAGVDQGAADSAVAGLVRALGAIRARAAVGAGAAAGPLRERDPDRRADRDRALDRRGRDQAEDRRRAGAPRHGRDRLRGDERQRRDLRRRRAAGDARLHRDRPRQPGGLRADRGRPGARARRWPGSRSPAASSPSSATWSTASTSPAPASAPSRSTRSSTARRVAPGDVVIGLPSSGLHSNGYTLARAALRRHRPRRRAPRPAARRGPARADRDLRQAGASSCCAPRSTSTASPTSPRAASTTCCGSPPRSATRSTRRCRSPPVFDLIQERGDVSDEEMHEVFNMGCGFCVVVPAADEAAALGLLRAHYPGAARIGRAVEGRRRSIADRRAQSPPERELRATNTATRQAGSRRGSEPLRALVQVTTCTDAADPPRNVCSPDARPRLDQLEDDRHRALGPLPARGQARQRRHVDRLPGPRHDARPRRSRSR